MNKLLLLLMLSLSFSGLAATEKYSFERELKNDLKKNVISESLKKKSLSKNDALIASKVLYQYYRQKEHEKYLAQWKDEKITLGDLTMKFFAKIPKNYQKKSLPLYISLHGGGGAPPKLNDQQWKNQKRLYQVNNALYVAPRAPTNSWDLWHKGHIDKFFAELIKGAILCYNVNPEKIYILGYSAGGDGTFQLAPRMADYWAGAAMMAGHPGDASAMNLLNLYFSIYMGGEDSAYDRNKHAKRWKTKLAKLAKTYPNCYKHDVEIYKKLGHWMNRKDAVAIKRLAKNRRNSYPKMVFWHQDNIIHNRFYWLAVPEGAGIAKSEIKAQINGQKIILKDAKKIKDLIIYLNDELVNLDLPVQIIYKNNVLFKGRLPRKIAILNKTLKERYDLCGLYSAEVKIKLPQ